MGGDVDGDFRIKDCEVLCEGEYGLCVCFELCDDCGVFFLIFGLEIFVVEIEGENVGDYYDEGDD